jgi:hypothetical protein
MTIESVRKYRKFGSGTSYPLKAKLSFLLLMMDVATPGFITQASLNPAAS